jgi:hypothetical protein
MGVNFSFVRSCNFDKWTIKQLKQMELGGNLNAIKYFEANKLFTNGQHDFTLPLAAKYRQELSKLAESSVPSKKIIVPDEARPTTDTKNAVETTLSKPEKVKPTEKEEAYDGSKIVVVKYHINIERESK